MNNQLAFVSLDADESAELGREGASVAIREAFNPRLVGRADRDARGVVA